MTARTRIEPPSAPRTPRRSWLAANACNAQTSYCFPQRRKAAKKEENHFRREAPFDHRTGACGAGRTTSPFSLRLCVFEGNKTASEPALTSNGLTGPLGVLGALGGSTFLRNLGRVALLSETKCSIFVLAPVPRPRAGERCFAAMNGARETNDMRQLAHPRPLSHITRKNRHNSAANRPFATSNEVSHITTARAR